jgi:hypothetical protein
MFPTNRGVCFRSKANPNDMKRLDSGAALAQESRLLLEQTPSLIPARRRPTLSYRSVRLILIYFFEQWVLQQEIEDPQRKEFPNERRMSL